jgi:hypothetical protein
LNFITKTTTHLLHRNLVASLLSEESNRQQLQLCDKSSFPFKARRVNSPASCSNLFEVTTELFAVGYM